MKKKLNVFCVLMLVLMLVETVLGGYMWLSEVKFLVAFNQNHSEGFGMSIFFSVFMVLVALVLLYPGIRAFVSFVKFIINVNRDKVFVKENVPLLRWTGLGLLFYNILMIISVLWVYYINNGYLQAYQIRLTYNQHSDAIIFCVFCLIIAEVFAIGLKLKEDQDLTI